MHVTTLQTLKDWYNRNKFEKLFKKPSNLYAKINYKEKTYIKNYDIEKKKIIIKIKKIKKFVDLTEEALSTIL